ncbi:hypothetical protein DF011_10655 [Burkholderia ubonensis]|uniref:Uncharacterized protein n=1 Tax=Burkholderia ubonensis TaxID=101571 RepID=A0AB74CXC7_9BURK|nr:hypothetical protein CJO70_02710 [Burkholderia ubonensis]PAJ95916.1 hypothetical protein CJO69_04290 [Burkholderia ubonensis]PAJ98737.1 hypothetical protein CJO68_23280 [Burkholderia ubonensis]PAK03532.1 hypothetical protein CJO67_34775 [Burkholderia ubonensis]RQP68797.1 hypothetical protein DF015_33305 [Burkholderia ubonensis]
MDLAHRVVYPPRLRQDGQSSELSCGSPGWRPAACTRRARSGCSARFDRRRGTQQIMLRRRPKTVESCRAAAPNRDNPHFGDA